MGTILDKPVTEKEDTASGTCNGLAYGVSGMQGWRVDMEDSHACIEEVAEDLKDHSLFAVFDGHGGSFAAKFAAEAVHGELVKQALFVEYRGVEKGERGGEKAVEMLREAMRLAFIEVSFGRRNGV